MLHLLDTRTNYVEAKHTGGGFVTVNEGDTIVLEDDGTLWIEG